MSAAKHSAAPWNIDCGMLTSSGRHIIATLHTWDEDAPEEGAANALLLKAAPDLLAELETAVALFRHMAGNESQRQWLFRSQQAIAKANGAAS